MRYSERGGTGQMTIVEPVVAIGSKGMANELRSANPVERQWIDVKETHV